MKKRILQVVNVPFVLPYYFGDQIDFLKELGFAVTIACSAGPELDEFCSKYNIAKKEIDIVRRIDVKTDIISLIKLIRLIRKEKFDYVIGHTPKGGLLAMLAARLIGVRERIYFRHGIVYETSSGFKRKLMIILEKLTSKCATKIVSVSRSVLDYASQNKINKPHKDVLLHEGTCNGVDFKRFKRRSNRSLKRELGLEDEDIVVGYVGRLVNDKGIKELMDAWKVVVENRDDVKLLLVGPFEERDGLSETLKDSIRSDKTVYFTGLVADTVPYYNIMDIFVLPSYREGFPTVVLEASAMELPVITTRSLGCVDSIIEGHTGTFTEIDGDAIAQCILYYVDHNNTRIRHGREGRRWVEENFDQKVIWGAIQDNLLGNH